MVMGQKMYKFFWNNIFAKFSIFSIEWFIFIFIIISSFTFLLQSSIYNFFFQIRFRGFFDHFWIFLKIFHKNRDFLENCLLT